MIMKASFALLTLVALTAMMGTSRPLLAAPLGPPSGPLYTPSRLQRQWSVEGLLSTSTDGIPMGPTFALRNTLAAKFLTFSGQTPAWQDQLVRSFSWIRFGAAIGSRLQYMIPFAIVRQGRYLVAAGQGSAAPVALSTTPAMEWLVRGEPAGGWVSASQPLVLRNFVRGDDLVFCPERLALTWQRECGPVVGPGEQPVAVAPTPQLVPATPVYPSVPVAAVQWRWNQRLVDCEGLRNLVEHKDLIYGKRTWGIDLVWDGNFILRDDAHRLCITIQGSDSQASASPVRYFRPAAIRVGRGPYLYRAYLKHGSRDYGIDLVWSDAAVYEWELHVKQGPLVGDEIGPRPARVAWGFTVALYNRTVRDYLVYCERDFGINLKWVRDCPRRFPGN
jgi:hypothetical protein